MPIATYYLESGSREERLSRLSNVWPVILSLCLAPVGGVKAADQTATPPAGLLGAWSSSDSVLGAVFGPGNLWDRSYGNWEQWKQDHHLPITLGAYNWFHGNHGGPNVSGYGIPGLRGTYFWYVKADPRLTLDNPAVSGVGAHVEFRFRESADKFRSFFPHTYWFYEAYGYLDTPAGRFKTGQIWKRFGLDWDGTWWGNAQYFDGLKLDTAYGLSWENHWRPRARFRLDSFLQYFPAKANLSGALVGANPESVPGSNERNLGVVRLVPTWQLTDKSSLALGLSALAGEIHNTPLLGRDSTSELAWAADATYAWGPFKVFGEADQTFGVLNPVRYVSGGPSDRITDVLVGATYRYGPVTFRTAWSAGFDTNPDGHQFLWVPGVTVALTRNVNFYAEYVRWNVTNRIGKETTFEDGFQLVLNWHL